MSTLIDSHKPLFSKIDRALAHVADGWTTPEQAHSMASWIVENRPAVSVEIGVFAGKGLVCMALAHRHIQTGKVIGIDPWETEASVEGQTKENKTWWGSLDHESIYQKCLASVKKFDCGDYVQIVRERSQKCAVPENIGLLRIDGNHGPASLVDVKRFAPNVVVGGVLYLDDSTWPNGPLENGADEWLFDHGWEKIGDVETTLIFKRIQ